MVEGKVAIVFGASGVSGWSFVNEILNDYPKKGVWSGVLALTNRPLTVEESFWPPDDRLSITSGINLLEDSPETIQKKLSDIAGIKKVTHLIYLAYKANTNNPEEVRENVEMFKRATIAVDKVCPNLEMVVNQTGAKAYGCHLLENRPAYLVPPFKEDTPRLEGAFAATLFYYPQLDWIAEYSKDKPWSWIETRPDIILGFVPNQNFYSLNMAIGFFLSLYREINGEGAACPFPGSDKSWVAKCQDSSAPMNARETIHVCFAPTTKKGDAFNVADERPAHCWRDKWPVLCSLFGLEGVKVEQQSPIEVRRYIKDNKATWEKMEDKYGLRKGQADNDRIFPGFEYFLLTQFDFDRQYDMSKLYDVAGFQEQRKPAQTWGGTFELMKKAKLIPAEFK
ncbi:hypothetical protein NLU13_4277 [Sarocladium strictum]|uniref:PRISE-like Rossmann-fold domain-containing protein n=1 Tax=Sarocladium strictum TaxID=5046 RepID=A0AA39GJY6_SARSR|nr:hypothetical protein NLU13_4277 [Sarocladium strictum]